MLAGDAHYYSANVVRRNKGNPLISVKDLRAVFESVRLVRTTSASEWLSVLDNTRETRTLSLPVSPSVYERAHPLSTRLRRLTEFYCSNPLSLNLKGAGQSGIRDSRPFSTTPLSSLVDKTSSLKADYSGVDVLVAIGFASLQAALLFSHASGRPVVHLASLAELPVWLEQASPSSAMVFLTSVIDSRTISTLRNLSRFCVGYLFAEDEDTLEWLAAKAAIYLFYKLQHSYDLAYRPGLETAMMLTSGHLTAISGYLPPEQQLAALATPKRVFALLTHSDGISTDLGHAAMCKHADWLPGSPLPSMPVPPCYVRDYCERLTIPVSDALANGRLISPRDLSAEILLYLVCWGIRSRGTITGNLALGDALCVSPNVRCLVTTLGSAVISDGVLFRALYGLWSGLTVGECIKALNSDRFEFIVVGDPSFTIARPAPACALYASSDRRSVQARRNQGQPQGGSDCIRLVPVGDVVNRDLLYAYLEIAADNALSDATGSLPVGASLSLPTGPILLVRADSSSQIVLNCGMNTRGHRLWRRLRRIRAHLDFNRYYFRSVFVKGRGSRQTELGAVIAAIEELINAIDACRSLLDTNRGLVVEACRSQLLWNEIQPRLQSVSDLCISEYARYAAEVGSTLLHHWTKIYRPAGARLRKRFCWVCGGALDTPIWYSTDVRPRAFRRVDGCYNCGIVYDGPVLPPASLTIGGDGRSNTDSQLITISQRVPGVRAWATILECSPRVNSVILPLLPTDALSAENHFVSRANSALPGLMYHTVACMVDGMFATWRLPVMGR